MSIKKTFTRDMGRLAIDPNQAGLVAGYDMVPNGVTLPDLSGNGNDGVILGPAFEFTSIGPSMRFDRINEDYINCGAGFQALTDVTVSFWVTLYSGNSTGWLLNYYLSSVDRWGISVRSLAPTTFRLDILDDIDNADNFWYTQILTYGQKYLVTAQMDNLENKLYINDQLVGFGNFSLDYWNSFLGNVIIGAGSPTIGFSDANISNLKIINRAITAAEIQAEYQAGAQAINWKSDYGVDVSIAAESAPGELSNSVVRKESGTWKISEDMIHGKTCKAIECVTDGVAVVQVSTAYFHGDDTQAAYGTFEWWMKKSVTGGTSPIFSFIGSQNTGVTQPGFNGYAYAFTAAEQIQFIKLTSGAASTLQLTVAGYVGVNQWHRCKVTRSADGVLTTYLDGVLVDTTGGIGTNPVTDAAFTISKYMVLDLDAGDKIAWAAPNGECAITKYQGVV